MTKYYHISTNLEHNGDFTPSIPQLRMVDEDSTTPRICVSKSIEGALSSIPNGGSLLYELLESTFGFIKVFEFDLDELNIPAKDIIDSNTLFEENLVEDANHTEEVWICTPISIPKKNQHIIHIYDMDEISIDIIPHHVLKLSEEKYNDDIESAYYDTFDTNIPTNTLLADIRYNSTKMMKGQTLLLPYMDSYNLDDLNNIIDEFKAPITAFEIDYHVGIKAKEDIDIEPYIIELSRRTY